MGEPYPDTQLFIAGAWRPASDGAVLPVEDPATGARIGDVASASPADVDAAALAAQGAFAAWAATPAHDRAAILRRAALLLRDRAEEIAEVLTREQGKPIAEARGEVHVAAEISEWYAEEGRRAYGRVIPARAPDVVATAHKIPIGPVAAFTPWNFPLNQAVRKVAAALAAGCTVVLKAPEETPAAPAALVRAFADAGVPAGALNLVYGDPAMISGRLIPHPAIRKVSFTGSTQVGKLLAGLAGQHMKPVTMELGGHAPVIVCADADPVEAATVLATAKFRNAGQVCISPTRFLVEAEVYDDFLATFTDLARARVVGNGLAEETGMGPLANPRRVEALDALVADAQNHGARLVTGGRRRGNVGNFFEPTVLAEVPAAARIMNEEPFGPVAIVNPVPSLDAAISESNRLPYGLASYAFTGSGATARRLVAEIEAGMVSVNHYGLGLPETPFGGVRDSGYGSEGGAEGITPYQTTKFSTVRL